MIHQFSPLLKFLVSNMNTYFRWYNPFRYNFWKQTAKDCMHTSGGLHAAAISVLHGIVANPILTSGNFYQGSSELIEDGVLLFILCNFKILRWLKAT
ncbi:uncharacterized protein CANTADRAFT_338980 [Suhomyces tanzawaensis NRRL Y-17324]|uniref:Uncharacterized protein n=1 Tax=Suhomyces tanzawaensis NRRL Y-17324 TaxID=984487 RepID=A0A1E4SAS3_9ASCO|nr:uncharacterized protein CANTADRAFT_338980 [Suhomyces tanzawaensis NRRL Y-17324]ODV76609.1 hypothetical protein CANTADRAFT_338980 [Suhomyces tanzawaensis NRRL Y-17324]